MGFLNPGPDDEYRIASQAQGGTSDVPGAGVFEGLGTAAFKGLGSAETKLVQTADGIGDSESGRGVKDYFSMMLGASTRTLLSPDQQDEARNEAAAAQKVVASWSATGQDPRETGVLGRIAAGTTENLSIGAIGAAAGGPWGAAALLGGTQGYSDYLQNKQDGLDDQTAMEKAGITGGFSAAGAFIPMKFGNNLFTSVAGGAGVNLVTGAASRAATSAVLEANGYKDMAAQYRVFDGEAMASDAILGAAFGAHGYLAHRGAALPADVDAALATQSEEHFNRSAPGIPTTPDVANAHVDTMRDAIDALARGDEPDVRSDIAQKLADNSLPDPNHDTLPMLNEAASAELNHYDEAIKPVDAIEPPVREAGQPIEQLQPPEPKQVAEGAEPAPKEPPPTPMDEMTLARMNQLLARGAGELPYTDENGNQTTVRQKFLDMQQEMGDSDRLAKAHEIAAACFISTGGAA